MPGVLGERLGGNARPAGHLGLPAVATGPAEVVGTAAGRVVRVGDLQVHLRLTPPPAALGNDPSQAMMWAARAVFTEVVLEVDAERRGVSSAAGVRAAVITELVLAGLPAQADVEAYYRRNLDRYRAPERRRARHVLLGPADLAGAETVARQARTGEPLALLAARWSLDSGSASAGGDLGWVGRGELAGQLEDAMFSAAVGTVVGPVGSPFGWHVLVVDDVDPRREPALAEVSAQIRAEMRRHLETEAFDCWLGAALKSTVVMEPGWPDPFAPGSFGRAHRH